MQPVVELPGPEDERGGEGYIVIEGTGLVKVEHAVTEHLGPDSQALAISQRCEHGIRHRTDTELQGRPRFDERGDAVADLLLDIAEAAALMGRHRLIDLDEVIDLVLVDLRIAVGVGHLSIGLDDDEAAVHASRLDCRREDVHLGPQAHGVEPPGRGIEEHDIGAEVVAEEHRHQAEPAGHVDEPITAPHSRSDKRRLVGDALTVREATLGIEHVQPVLGNDLVECPEEHGRCSKVS